MYTSDEHSPFHFQPDLPTRSHAEAVRPTIGAMLIHGFMGTPAEMRPLGRALCEAGVEVRGVLLPGFGPDIARLSQIRRQDWFEEVESTWSEIVEAHPQTVLIGFSLGGALATVQAAMTRRPPNRLVLLAPWLKMNDWRGSLIPLVKHVKKEIKPFADADFSDPDVRQVFAEGNPSLDLDDPATQERLREESTIPLSALDELRRTGRRARSLTSRLQMPTLVVQGVDDEISLPKYTAELTERFSRSNSPTQLLVSGDHLVVRDDRPSWPTVRDRVVDFATTPGRD